MFSNSSLSSRFRIQMMQNLFGDQSEEEEKEVEAVESERESNRQPDYASCAKRSFVGDNGDRISRLPDELLVDILSLLSLKEAARTSVLSPRWINLWKHTHSLNFDARNALEDIVKKHWIRRKLMKREGPKYVKWVNTVLQSHKSPTLKEFVIRFTLDATAKNSINLWLQFAFATRQVESNCATPKLQTPSNIFWIHRPLVPENFKSLKDLSFKSVNLSGAAIEFFLHNCPLLERLVVHRSRKISSLEVCGPSLRLKHLELIDCYDFKTLKVSLPNLTSLLVTIIDILLLEYVPMLVEVSVSCDDDGATPKRFISALPSCISQLQTLRLELYTTTYEWGRLPRKDREIKDSITSSPHHHLKSFKYSGYYGRHCDVALLGYVLENCFALEKIIIDPSGSYGLDKLNMEQIGRKNAKQQLEPQIPEH
ncbi:hypothetical protein MIMGU_mgv1a025965mg, partial [Erythranthe guttata]